MPDHQQSNHQKSANQSRQDLLYFGALCVASFVLLLGVAWVTQDRIQHNQTQAALAQIRSIVPAQMQVKVTLKTLEQLQKQKFAIVAGCFNSVDKVKTIQPAAVSLFLAQVQGYSSQLQVLVSIKFNFVKSMDNFTVKGVTILPPQQETPGLGDVILRTKSTWILQFTDQVFSRNEVPFAAEKFDTVTGATISTQAVIKGVTQALKQAQQMPYQRVSEGLLDDC